MNLIIPVFILIVLVVVFAGKEILNVLHITPPTGGIQEKIPDVEELREFFSPTPTKTPK